MIWLMVLLGIAWAGDAETVRRWVDASGGERFMPKDYTEGLRILEGMGPRAVPELVNALEARTDLYELSFVCDALERIPDQRAVSALQNRMAHNNRLVRSSCASAYASLAVHLPHQGALREPLRAVLFSDPECSVRVNTAMTAGPLEDSLIRAHFEPRLVGGGECDQRVAIYVLSGATTEVERLGIQFTALLKDSKHTSVREAAATGVGELGYKPARATLIGLIQQDPPPKGNIKANSIRSLGEIGNPNDIPVLQQIIKTDKWGSQGVFAVRSKEAIAKIQSRY
jgi:HEAT repeat protein